MDAGQAALRLQWTFGFNNKLVGGVHNLSEGDRIALFYVRCAHCPWTRSGGQTFTHRLTNTAQLAHRGR